ncbi:MAG: ABC transporter substrate-binding protein [Sphaerochaeta sp.]|uniref:ABC transporter substrate-binding protein n=1 Tax=unclassified Sphaerochaeta TaxID=2637943 RepID=UPI000A7BF04C|nr:MULTISPECIES: ABC transporter substrate-binding protein [unclassified Sphaerochaeta]
MKKTLCLILVGLLIAGSLFAGGASEATKAAPAKPAGPVEITFWHAMGGVNGEALASMVDEFNKQNEGKIKVKYEFQGNYDDEFAKIQASGGNYPCDIIQVYDIGTRYMIDSGWILPVQEYIEKDKYDISQIEPNIAAYYTVDNTLYSMPFNSSTPLLYYNKTAFEEAGITKVPTCFEDIYEIAEKLKIVNPDGTVKRYGYGMGNYGWFFEQWIGKMGLHYVNNNNGRGKDYATAVEFDTNGGGLQIIKVWDKILKEGISPYLNMGNDDAKAAFISGNVCMIPESTAALKSLLLNVGDKFEIGVAYFPSINRNDVGGVSVGGGSLWMMDTGKQEREDATWEFLKFMVSPEMQAFWNAKTGYFPVTVAAAQTATFKENIAKYPQFQVAIDQLHSSAPQYAGALLSVFSEARQIVQNYIARLANNELDPQATLNGMAKDINKAIETYNLVNY